MEIKTRDEQGHIVMEVTGRLDANTTPEFEKRCADSIKKEPCKMILDLSGLEYISSSGLRSLLTLAKKLRTTGGNLAICSLAGIVKDVINLSGFHQFLPVFDNVENAIRG